MATAEMTRNIAQMARELRGKVVDINSVRPTPVVAAAARLGFGVSDFIPNERTQNVSGAVNHDKKMIFVNASETSERKRFTIAHELGHVMLHAGDGNVVDYRQQMEYGAEAGPKEREANQFAAELLMPRNVFEALWNAYGGKVASVAEQLQVSKPAAAVRAKELRLV